jgi:hypothetical protein
MEEMKEYYSSDKKLMAVISYQKSGGYSFPRVEEVICLEHKLEYVKKLSITGNYLLRQQCKVCGEAKSTGLKNRLVDNVNSLPDFIEDLYEVVFNFKKEAVNSFRVEPDMEMLNEYNNYLNSDKWKLKRKKVLERDNHLCQACLTNKANEVHHLTYQNIYDEPLFELISVCKRCHEKIESKKPHKK